MLLRPPHHPTRCLASLPSCRGSQPGVAILFRCASPEKSQPEATTCQSVFRPLFRRPTSDHLTTTTVRFVSTLALISDYSRVGPTTLDLQLGSGEKLTTVAIL
ncbi:hypothetical protein PanWU01x14_115430 [Parasponia andersonii]|uniref:Uncharacterized protein n=1 Tax=Parasponia andersonii TaxID=3476 RepID=A0A2P5CXM4_PARAD|nr:hypothetical protein PanWU01x14_115430 [Parasponia andersonii]